MFYTYVLIDPRDDSVFYVGKGKGYRSEQHVKSARKTLHRNPKLQNKINKIISMGLMPYAEKIFEHEDEWPCLANEIAAISDYGRDSLCNLTDGGEGGSNPTHEARALKKERMKGNTWRKGIPHSEETRVKMRSAQQAIRKSGKDHPSFGRKASPEERERMSESHKGEKAFWFGKHHTEQSKAKLRAANLGKKHSDESKSKLSAASLGKPKSQQMRDRLSATNKGRSAPWASENAKSPAARSKIRAAKLGKNLSMEHRIATSIGRRRMLQNKAFNPNQITMDF
jgi:hypothetical protein